MNKGTTLREINAAMQMLENYGAFKDCSAREIALIELQLKQIAYAAIREQQTMIADQSHILTAQIKG
jgi:hypothetical protein